MKTHDEIIQRIKTSDDFFGFAGSALLELLPFDVARPLLAKDTECTAETWKWHADRAAVLACMRDYMEFAWDKVVDHRGISASRSVEKFGAWLWALGDEETLRKFEATDYAPYGAPQLAFVCETYGFQIPRSTAIRRMVDGSPCSPACSGCRS